MASAAAADTDKLGTLMQTLPQELYDKIYHFTFGAVQVLKVTIDANYQPPATLQVNRISRAIFCEAYYDACDFRFSNVQRFCQWLSEISASHQDMIQNVTYEGPMSYVTDALGINHNEPKWIIDYIYISAVIKGAPSKVARLLKFGGSARDAAEGL